MVKSFDVIQQINAYLEGKISLNSFRDWIVDAHLEIESQSKASEFDRDAATLLASIEGQYAELSDEIVSDGLWRERLRALIAPRTLELFKLTFYYQASQSAAQANTSWGLGPQGASFPLPAPPVLAHG